MFINIFILYIVVAPNMVSILLNLFLSCGKNVGNLRKGDRIAIEPGYSCRKCNFCKVGSYNICTEMVFCATPPVDGNLRSDTSLAVIILLALNQIELRC